MRLITTANKKQCALLLCLLIASALCGCAGSAHSTENFQTRNLNSCSDMADNQKNIDQIQARISDLHRDSNSVNALQTSQKIEDSKEQILEITSANATQVQNCGPVVVEASR